MGMDGDLAGGILEGIKDGDGRRAAEGMLEWLAASKVSLGGKYKGKRWGRVSASGDGGWSVRVNVQYDDRLEGFLSSETADAVRMVRAQEGHMGCPRCKPGKCQFTGAAFADPGEPEVGLIKRLILYRIDAIKDGRIPKCSYVKVSMRGEALGPCAAHKSCDPRCRAMKNP
ncbi:MAG: hypothetical protein FWE70_08840 [Oscillospiraceae bacterium]|nr:hypothetical protein [Oscillospiraceae bacterium]